MTKTKQLSFTYIIEFRGGTYCSQVKAGNVNESIAVWIEKLKSELPEIPYLGKKTVKEVELLAMEEDHKPVLLNGLENAWYISYLTKQGFLRGNIVQTDTTG